MSSLQTLPDSETIRRTVQEVIQRPEYQLGPRPDDGGAFRDLFLRVMYWLLTPLR